MNEDTEDRWVFERSSGYAGWRCTKCATWVYNNQPKICDCDKHKKRSDKNEQVS